MTIEPEPCTNWYHTRQHLSTNLAPSSPGKGRRGKALCKSGPYHVDVWDEEAINDALSRYRAKLVVVADLPACKLCLRKAAKLAAEVTP